MSADSSPVALCSFDNTYARCLEGFYAPCNPATTPRPVLLRWNRSLAEELRLDASHLEPDKLAQIFSGNELPSGSFPLAQAYAGHQFGGFVPQLGDGRALLIGEVIDRDGRRRDIAMKGSGPTPFSRGGDGKAAVGPEAGNGSRSSRRKGNFSYRSAARAGRPKRIKPANPSSPIKPTKPVLNSIRGGCWFDSTPTRSML